MALRDIIILPDKRLRLVSKPVGKITAEIRTLVEDMFETMYEAPGIGLAAIQVGVPQAGRHHGPCPRRKASPSRACSSIRRSCGRRTSRRSTRKAACRSRKSTRTSSAPPRCGSSISISTASRTRTEAEGLFATCIQHEVDHLNGVLFIDHISKLKRDRIVKKFTKAAKRAEEEA